jgi:hypothetical protein
LTRPGLEPTGGDHIITSHYRIGTHFAPLQNNTIPVLKYPGKCNINLVYGTNDKNGILIYIDRIGGVMVIVLASSMITPPPQYQS